MRLNGCHNKPDPLPVLAVQDGWNPDGTRRMKHVVDEMSKPCRYDLRPTDPACEGCRHRHTAE